MTIGAFKPMWLLRRRAAALLARAERDPSPANIEAIARWRDQDPRRSALIDRGSAVLRQSVQLSNSRVAAGALPKIRPEPVRAHLALAASLVLSIFGIGIIYLAWTNANQRVEAVLLTTGIGEIRQIPLSDGTKLILDTGTKVRVEIGRNHRQALVDHGRARFAITREDTPFTIRTATAAVRVERGVVDVTSDAAGTDIELLRGTAQIVRPNGSQTQRVLVLHAPTAVSTSDEAVRTLPSHEPRDWPSGRLTFANTRLADVAAAANRYSTTQIIIGEPAIGELRVTGVFKAGDQKPLAKSLSAVFGLRLGRDEKGNIVLRSRRAEP